jgi:DNA-binding NarL/FixJ family response regulator
VGATSPERPARASHLNVVGADASPASPARVRTLVADDNAGIRQLLATLLSLEPDFELVGEAEDGRAALESAGDAEIDLLVLDLSMPHLDGLEVLEQLAVSRPDLCVVVYTGMASEAVAERALALGARDVVVKGAAPEELVERLRAAARR